MQRRALVNVPPNKSPDESLPLVFVFHGAGGDGRAAESSTGLTALGNRDGFITAYPYAAGRYWNVTGRDADAPDDVAFARSLLEQLDDRLCVDGSRVFATGSSNGASFVARIGCELSDRIAAIAPVAGGYGSQPPCQPHRPVSVLEIHGTGDRTVPYDGGPNGQVGVWRFLAAWNDRDACPGTPARRRRLGRRALWFAKVGCAGGTTVAHIKLVGEPHTWPTTRPIEPGERARVPFSARQAVWQFFATRTVSARPVPRSTR